MLSLEEMEIMLNEVVLEFPEELFDKLNGGILLLPEMIYNTKVENSNLLVLGQYHINGNLGRYITIYYGSIMHMFGHRDKKFLKQKLTEVLKHEFIHHLESLAGENKLAVKDAEDINDYLKRRVFKNNQ